MSDITKILRAAVEQEMLFPSEELFKRYLEKFCEENEPFEIVDEVENEDGTMTVVLRTRYNDNVFYRKEPEFEEPRLSGEKLKLFLKELTVSMEKEIGDWESLPDTDEDRKFRERMLSMILDMEQQKK